ncbi:MAG: zinc-ribbon domain-containing protein [Sphingomonas sp.]
MILECTDCHTRYLVPDTAIGPEGRTVRCANCRYSWFQPPAAALDLVERATALHDAAEQPPGSVAQGFAARHDDTGGAGHRFDAASDPPSDDMADIDAFAHQPPFRPRRNPAARYTLAALAAGGVMLAGVAVILYSGQPGIAAQLGLGAVTETPLQIQRNPIDRRDLENGSEMLAVSGRIVNPSSARQPVPNIRAELKDAQGRLVYSWVIEPNVRQLAPGGSVDFNSAEFDVPSNSKKIDLSFSSATAR